MLKAIIFDIDGVITNLNLFQYVCWKSVFSQYGVNLTPKVWSRYIHKPRRTIAAGVAHDLHFVVNETQIDEICTKKDALFQHLISSGLKPTNVNEGIKELLIDAKKHGLKLACASLSSNARLELERLGLFETFDYVTDYKNHIFDSFSEREKTLTSTTTLVLKSLKLDSSEVIGLEDDITGIVDYNRHGVYSVAISHFNPKIAAKANFAVDLPQQLNLEEIIFNYYQNDRSDF